MTQADTRYDSVYRPDLFAGQLHIVTGGGSGIGRCIAHELASLGATVALLGRTESKLQTVATEIREDGGEATPSVCDIRDEAQVKAVVGALLKQYGRVHGLVNNAGGQFPAPLETMSRNAFDAVIQNNLTGTFVMAREVFSQSMREHGGAIVNVIAECEHGFPGMGHTGAARAGVENLTRTAAWEWGPFAVRVNAVAPGVILSSGLDNYDEAMQKQLAGLGRQSPLKRPGTEAELSSAVVFLLSPGGAYTTGETLHVGGGIRFNWQQAAAPLPKNAAIVSPNEGFHRAQLPEAIKKYSSTED
jgi:citronellol/citronellal dehydrogenase